MTAGILWPPPSQLFHSGGSQWLKCTPGQPQTWGWTAAACWLGYSGLSAERHKPSLRQSETGDKSVGLCLPWATPPVPTSSPSLAQGPLPKPLRGFQPLQTPQDKAVLAQSPQKESHPLSPAKKPLQPPGHKKGFAQISGIRGSRVWSFTSLPSIYTSSVLLSKASYQNS